MTREDDSGEVNIMACAVHRLTCVPLIGTALEYYDRHVGGGDDPLADEHCRSRARFLVGELNAVGWHVVRE